MDKRYNKQISEDGEVLYIEDPNGRYSENDFSLEGLNVIDGKLEKSYHTPNLKPLFRLLVIVAIASFWFSF